MAMLRERFSLEKSAEVAGVSLWSLLDELRDRNVALKYSITDAES
jgi:predicted HTH domain antitoxin